MTKLTKKQEMFCREYLVDLNATQAAIRAGYCKNSARQQSSDLLSKLDIKQKIDELIEERSKKTEINAEYVIRSLKEIAEKCGGKAKVEKNGEEETIFDAAGANKALELLGKHLKLFTDKHEIEEKLIVKISKKRFDSSE